MSAESDFGRMIQLFMEDDPLVATYHQYSQGSYNPATSEYETAQVDTLVQAILLDLTGNSNGSSSKFGTSISEGDMELYFKPFSDSPLVQPVDTTSDKVTVGGVIYKVAVMKSVNPMGNSPMLYNLMLKR